MPTIATLPPFTPEMERAAIASLTAKTAAMDLAKRKKRRREKRAMRRFAEWCRERETA